MADDKNLPSPEPQPQQTPPEPTPFPVAEPEWVTRTPDPPITHDPAPIVEKRQSR